MPHFSGCTTLNDTIYCIGMVDASGSCALEGKDHRRCHQPFPAQR